MQLKSTLLWFLTYDGARGPAAVKKVFDKLSNVKVATDVDPDLLDLMCQYEFILTEQQAKQLKDTCSMVVAWAKKSAPLGRNDAESVIWVFFLLFIVIIATIKNIKNRQSIENNRQIHYACICKNIHIDCRALRAFLRHRAWAPILLGPN